MIPLGLLEELSRARPGTRVAVDRGSTVEVDGLSFAMIAVAAERILGIAGPGGAAAGFEVGQEFRSAGQVLSLCPLTHANAERLRSIAPFTAPSPLAHRAAGPAAPLVTFGVGDRLGVAGPGHIRALRRFAALPVLAQQSVRELTLTNRSFEEVLDASTWAVFQEGLRKPWGADADHLKTEEWVRTAIGAGFTMITADVSDHIRAEHASRPASEVRAAYARLDASSREQAEQRYLSRSFSLEGGKAVRFSEVTFKKTVLVYSEAVRHAARLYQAAAQAAGTRGLRLRAFDRRDRSPRPRRRRICSRRWRRSGWASPSPPLPRASPASSRRGSTTSATWRSSGRLSPRTRRSRAASATGSPCTREATSSRSSRRSGSCREGAFHIKTAGTSWLEALRVVAAADPRLFRELYAVALERYEEARKLYHVTPDLSTLPSPAEPRSMLPAVGSWTTPMRDGSCTSAYGEMLAVPRLREAFSAVLRENLPGYWDAPGQPHREAPRSTRRPGRGCAPAACRERTMRGTGDPRPAGRGVVLLDFDGVICDSVDECLVTSFRAYYDLQGNPAPASGPVARRESFARLRPFIHIGEDYLLIHELIDRGIEIPGQKEFDIHVQAAGRAKMMRFRELFYSARAEVMARDRNAWLDMNRIYPRARDALRAAAGKPVYILSTKRRAVHPGDPFPRGPRVPAQPGLVLGRRSQAPHRRTRPRGRRLRARRVRRRPGRPSPGTIPSPSCPCTSPRGDTWRASRSPAGPASPFSRPRSCPRWSSRPSASPLFTHRPAVQ